MRHKRYWSQFPPYVPVAQRRAQALKQAATLAKRGAKVEPVADVPRSIVATFWGQAWCRNLERYSDYGNRLPRGKSYLRNGAVVDLRIQAGIVSALVSGSSLYQIEITIRPVIAKVWTDLIRACAGEVGSLIELLQGRLSNRVMEKVTAPGTGLFPAPREITMRCSCPDSAEMCKHLAAVMYGIGHRLDHNPGLLFDLRQVSQLELIAAAVPVAPTARRSRSATAAKTIATTDLGSVFGIEIDPAPASSPSPVSRPKPRSQPAAKTAPSNSKARSTKKKPAAKANSATAASEAEQVAQRRRRIAAAERRRWAKVRAPSSRGGT